MANPPEYLRTKRMTGRGVSTDILDRAVWRKANEPDDAWVAALDKADRGNAQALTDLLRSQTEIPPSVRHYLADFAERRVQKRGRPRVPLYDRSRVEVFLWLANDEVSHRPPGQKLEDALAAAAAHYGLTVANLRKYRTGHRTATSRRKKAMRGG
jgi:hypothetical protein